jgi:hypothetical protein
MKLRLVYCNENERVMLFCVLVVGDEDLGSNGVSGTVYAGEG